MASEKSVRSYDEVFYEIVDKVDRMGKLSLPFDNDTQAYLTRQEFYAFRAAVRRLHEKLGKLTLSLNGATLEISRKESVYVSRLQEGIKNDTANMDNGSSAG